MTDTKPAVDLVQESEILRDQLEFLLEHHGPECAAGKCPACARLEQVKVVLLKVFEAGSMRRVRRHAA